jgi:alginate O-acetyltransferase complex protein AlgI
METLAGLLQALQYNAHDPLLFNSAFFLFFFFFFFVVYQFIYKKTLLRIIIVSAFSLYFFYKACGWYVCCIIIAAIVDYNLSNRIYTSTHKKNKKALLLVSIIANLGLLFFFKYTNLFIDTMNSLAIGKIEPLQLLLPIGISFYTFENVSYTVDVYQGKFKPVQSFWDYLFFLSFFPKLMMGPIVRAADFVPQIRKKIVVSPQQLSEGVYLIASGIFKKMIIADYIYGNYVERIFDNPSRYSGVECVAGVYGYALVIYGDFSGYSDMALGMGKWMGFEINKNFDAPYQSKSITEFWRRWHISLSSWLKDYLYIPLGGNKLGKLRQYINLFITMLLGGLWHGASWNFVFWGGLHGTALGMDKFKNELLERHQKLKRLVTRYRKVFAMLGILVTFHFVCFCWIFFKTNSFADSWNMLHQITYNFNGSITLSLLTAYSSVFVLMAIGFILHYIPPQKELKFIQWLTAKSMTYKVAFLLAIILVAIQMKQAQPILPVYLQF